MSDAKRYGGLTLAEIMEDFDPAETCMECELARDLIAAQEELDRLRSRQLAHPDAQGLLAALSMATPGVWRGDADGGPHKGKIVDDAGETIASTWCGGREGHGARNAEAIAAAHNHAVALINELEAAQARIAELERDKRRVEAALENALDASAEGGWMARALDAEATIARVRAVPRYDSPGLSPYGGSAPGGKLVLADQLDAALASRA